MLTDRDREFLAGYIDGELTARQRRAVSRLLERSAEARALLRKMQHDAAALQAMSHPPLDRDLSGPVLRTIAERRLQPGSRRRRIASPRPAALPMWVGFGAVAASLLLIVAASYFYFAASMEPHGSENAVADNGISKTPGKSWKDLKRDTSGPGQRRNDDSALAHQGGSSELVPLPARASEANEPPTAVTQSNAKPSEADVVGAPGPIANMEMFQLAKVTQLRIIKLSDLEQESERQQLLQALRREPGYRIESPCKDSTKAFDRLQAVLTAQGIGLVIDQAAQARMNARRAGAKIKTNFVLYVEDVMPDELLKALRQVALDDRNAEAKKKGDGQFDSIVLNRMTDGDREELCKLLGLKVKKLPDVAPPTGPLGTDVRKPVADKTGDDITKALTGQGGVPRPDPGKQPVKAPERLALAMPYNPARPRPESAEIKRFLTNRKAARPGAVQLLLVVREIGG
jgi:hypothetical protein